MPDLGPGGWLALILTAALIGLIVEGVIRDRRTDRKEGGP